MNNYSIFDLMSPEEAKAFAPEPESKKPQLTGVLSSDLQHAAEKKGLQGEYAEGWEEATVTASSAEPNTKSVPKSSTKRIVPVDQTAQYLSYPKKLIHWGKVHIIDDPSLSLEQIRKRYATVYPDLSTKHVEFIYEPPVIPKPKKAKKAPEDQEPKLDFGETEPTEESGKIQSEDAETVDDNGEEESEDNDSQAKEEKAVQLLPSVVNGEQLYGLIITMPKGKTKNADDDLIRTFYSWAELKAKPAEKNLLIGKNGIYEVRINDIGLFCARVKKGFYPEGEDVQEGFSLNVPRIPGELLQEALNLFRYLAVLDTPLEALVRFYYKNGKYFLWVPHQKVGRKYLKLLDYPEDEKIFRENLLVLEMHSHNTMGAFFSSQDNEDEVPTGFYAVVGNAHTLQPHLNIRFSCAGNYRQIAPEGIFDQAKNGVRGLYVNWLERIHPSLEYEEEDDDEYRDRYAGYPY